MKTCSVCSAGLPLEAFPRDRHCSDGRSGRCKACNVARNRRWRNANPDKRPAYHLRRRYGMSAADYTELLKAQGGACAVCAAAATRLVVDHCHTSGTVRGLLCDNCNLAIGQAQDDPARLRAAADYLERSL